MSQQDVLGNKVFLDNKDWHAILQPVFLIYFFFFFFLKSHLSGVLLCHCCFPYNMILVMMYDSGKGGKSFIIRAREDLEHIYLLRTSPGFINPSLFSFSSARLPSHESRGQHKRALQPP